jgi:acyl dehydratase
MASPVGFTEDGIVAFARRYDPQPFHTDPAAAARSQFGGLIASGIQVMAECFAALINDGFLAGTGMGSPGLDEVRWQRPVRPGDTLRMRCTVLERRTSSTRPDRGYVTVLFEAVNQRGEVAMSYRCLEIVRRRNGA